MCPGVQARMRRIALERPDAAGACSAVRANDDAPAIKDLQVIWPPCWVSCTDLVLVLDDVDELPPGGPAARLVAGAVPARADPAAPAAVLRTYPAHPGTPPLSSSSPG